MSLLVLIPGFVAVGGVLGVLGGGGSILTVPLFVYAGQLAPREAIASSLFVVAATSAAAVVARLRSGLIDFKVGIPFAATAMLGASAGGRLASFVAPNFLLIGFALVMLATSASMLRRRKPLSALPARASLTKVLVVALPTGLLSGLVGAGGGFLVVPALTLFAGLGMPSAVATSLFVITLQSAAALVAQPAVGNLDLTLLSAVSFAAILGALGATRLSRHVSAKQLRTAFGWLVLVMGVFVLVRQTAASPELRADVQRLLSHLSRLSLTVSSEFNPLPALAGGLLIALAATLHLLGHGRIAGISGMLGAVVERRPGEWTSALAFIGGLLLTGIVTRAVAADCLGVPPASLATIAIAGLLVGYGTRLGNGCTSGHGVCGVSSLSPRSIAATLTFMLTGITTVTAVRLLGGGS